MLVYSKNFFRLNIFLVFVHLRKWGNRWVNGENKDIKEGGREYKDKRQVRGEIENELDVGLIDGGKRFGFWLWLWLCV